MKSQSLTFGVFWTVLELLVTVTITTILLNFNTQKLDYKIYKAEGDHLTLRTENQ